MTPVLREPLAFLILLPCMPHPRAKASSLWHRTTRPENSKRMFQLGVRRKRPIKRMKKKLLNNLLEYLTYDSYMFAPLVSRPPSAFSSSSKQMASVRGVEVKKPVREKKKLLKNIRDYLKSNSYMYAPLLAPTRSRIRPPKGPSVYLERVTTFEVSKRKVILGGYKPNENLADVILNDQTSKGSLAVQKERVKQKDTMKHMVHNSCRSSSLPGVGCVLWHGKRNAGLPDKEAY